MLKSSSLCLYSSNLGTEKRGDEIKKNIFSSETTEPISANFAEMILRWSPFEIVSVSALLYPRWPPLLKIDLYSSNLGTFWLKIEQFWAFEEISIFSNGGHLGYSTALTDTILKGDHLKNRNFFKCPKLLYFKPESAQI
jgi:hypothetical protein